VLKLLLPGVGVTCSKTAEKGFCRVFSGVKNREARGTPSTSGIQVISIRFKGWGNETTALWRGIVFICENYIIHIEVGLQMGIRRGKLFVAVPEFLI
jgi:hypothetical protein